MISDRVYHLLSDGLPALIDKALEHGADFDEVIQELRDNIETAVANRDEYGA